MRLYLFWVVVAFFSLVTLKDPFVGVVSYTLINIVRPEMFFWGSTSGAKAFFVFFAATLVGIVLNFKKIKEANICKIFVCKEVFLWAFIYFAFLILMALSDYNVDSSYPYVHEIGKNALLGFLLFFVLTSKEKVLRYEMCLLLALTFLGVWGIEQHARGNVRLEGLGGASWGDSNGVAAVFVLLFPVAFGLVNKSQKHVLRYFGLSATIVIVLLIFYTGSRGGGLGLVASILMIWVKMKRKILIVSSFLLLGLFILPFVDQQYIDRFSNISASSDPGQMDASASSRLVFWEAALLIFADNPVCGVGFGAYPEAKLAYRDHFSHLDGRFLAEYFRSRDPYVTHSTYFQVLSEGGLLLITPFMAIIAGTFISNRNLRKQVPETPDNEAMFSLLAGIEAGIFGYCVCIAFINSIVFTLFPLQTIICAKIRIILYSGLNNTLEVKEVSKI